MANSLQQNNLKKIIKHSLQTSSGILRGDSGKILLSILLKSKRLDAILAIDVDCPFISARTICSSMQEEKINKEKNVQITIEILIME